MLELLSCALVAVMLQAREPPEVVMLVLIDDLGFADIQPNGPWSPTPHIGALAKEGVLLANMHAYKYCSPSRRSLLSGRFPVHISGKQAPACSNFLPLQLTLLSEKMKLANFSTHFFGRLWFCIDWFNELLNLR
jgi:arylsulfatase A-like enzyme